MARCPAESFFDSYILYAYLVVPSQHYVYCTKAKASTLLYCQVDRQKVLLKYIVHLVHKVKNSNISCGRWHMFTSAFFSTSNIDNGWGHEKFPLSCWTWWEDDKRPAKFEVKNERVRRMKDECFLHLLLLSAFLYPIDQISSHCILHSIFHRHRCFPFTRTKATTFLTCKIEMHYATCIHIVVHAYKCV